MIPGERMMFGHLNRLQKGDILELAISELCMHPWSLLPHPAEESRQMIGIAYISLTKCLIEERQCLTAVLFMMHIF